MSKSNIKVEHEIKKKRRGQIRTDPSIVLNPHPSIACMRSESFVLLRHSFQPTIAHSIDNGTEFLSRYDRSSTTQDVRGEGEGKKDHGPTHHTRMSVCERSLIDKLFLIDHDSPK